MWLFDGPSVDVNCAQRPSQSQELPGPAAQNWPMQNPRSSPGTDRHTHHEHLRRRFIPLSFCDSCANVPIAFSMAGFQGEGYYDRRYRQNPALVRARRPYLVKNAIAGITLAAFTAGVCQ
ncbi:hypothetical protein OOU_Y34scaffold00979g48 [Pyricularia oryzae Y34]|uniref:Uncharacterized protein n=2 Tax=Pyricularia oryzae TaxID=318829 RepID=A0AA97NN52_PYRO3|nr:hypothetical protein OOU_Y34scaffold00979g48 [Pyricularia oryzae Y34]